MPPDNGHRATLELTELAEEFRAKHAIMLREVLDMKTNLASLSGSMNGINYNTGVIATTLHSQAALIVKTLLRAFIAMVSCTLLVVIIAVVAITRTEFKGNLHEVVVNPKTS